MLETIWEGIQDIIAFFEMIIDFILGLFEDIAYVAKLLGDTVADLPALFGWLPVEVVASVVGIFAIVVIYKVLGRD